MNLNLVKMAREAGFHIGDQFAAGCTEDDLRKLSQLITSEIKALEPQQRTWVGLTSEDYNEIFKEARSGEHAVQLAEARLKGKNT